MVIVQLTTDNRQDKREFHKPAPWFGTAPEALLQGLARLPELQVHVVSCIQQPVSSPEKLAQNIWFHSLHVPKRGWLRTGYQGCIRAVRQKVRELRPDIVHAQGTERDCALGAVFSGRPNVVTIHGNMAELARLFCARPGSYGWLAGHFESFALERTHGVFCNSSYTEELVKPRARRTWLVPNAIREDFFAAPITTGIRQGRVLLNVGVISPRKRQLELLHVARALHESGRSFELHFVGECGDDLYGQDFKKEISRARDAGYARHLGVLSTAEIIRCFDESQALIHFPSEESFGLVVPEALARGLKVFAARVGGIRDILESMPGAEEFLPDDWNGLQASLVAWLDRKPETSHAARCIVRERYHPEQIARRHIQIYREVLSTCS